MMKREKVQRVEFFGLNRKVGTGQVGCVDEGLRSVEGGRFKVE